jgi:outer membrane lipopolysaccharide assembly protein LptE/RlpB
MASRAALPVCAALAGCGFAMAGLNAVPGTAPIMLISLL